MCFLSSTWDLFDAERMNWDDEIPDDAVVHPPSAADAPLGDFKMICLDRQVKGHRRPRPHPPVVQLNYTQEAGGKLMMQWRNSKAGYFRKRKLGNKGEKEQELKRCRNLNAVQSASSGGRDSFMWIQSWYLASSLITPHKHTSNFAQTKLGYMDRVQC